MIEQDRPKVDLAFSKAIDDSDRQAFLDGLEAEGLSVGKVGDYGTKALGLEPIQVWISLYESGLVQGLGVATIGGACLAFKAAWQRWRNHLHEQHHQLPAANLRVGTAIYILPEDDPDAAIAAIPADQAQSEPPKGDRMWDTRVGWEGVMEHWKRVGREEAEQERSAHSDTSDEG